MKPRNSPARRLQRQINANRDRSQPYTEGELKALADARQVRTKKNRVGR